MKPKKTRLDVALVDRQLVDTRSKAQSLIMARRVLVNDQYVDKPGSQVADDDVLRVAELEHPWVGRGGMKLAHALREFSIDVDGKVCVDIGASTGGFTDVMLEKYIAMYQNPDVWSDYKRTCLPVLTPFGTATEVPGRLPYSSTERTANPNIPLPSAFPAGTTAVSQLRNWNDPNACPRP